MDGCDRSVTSGVLAVLDVAYAVLSGLNVDLVLERLLEAARQLTGARYAALGVSTDRGASSSDS